MTTLQEELSRQMGMKAALVQTTATPGWLVIQQISEKLVQKAIEEGMGEENRDKRDEKILKASALRKGFNELFGFIESVKQYDPTQSGDDSGLGQLEFESNKQ